MIRSLKNLIFPEKGMFTRLAVLFSVGFVIFAASWSVGSFRSDRRATLEAQETRALHQARLASEITDGILQSVDLTIGHILTSQTDPRLLLQPTPMLQEMIRQRAMYLETIDRIVLVGPGGGVIFTSGEISQDDFSRTNFFLEHRDKWLDFHVGRIQLPGRPPQLCLSRRITLSGGGFGGLVMALLSPQYFQSRFAPSGDSPFDLFVLYDASGEILAAWPDPTIDGTPGEPKDISELPLVRNLTKALLQTGGTIKESSGEATVTAMQLRNFPLRLAVAFVHGHALIVWQNRLFRALIMDILLTAIVCGLIIVFGHLLDRRETLRRQIETSRTQARLTQMLGDLALVSSQASDIDEAYWTCLRQVCGQTGWSAGCVYQTGDSALNMLWHRVSGDDGSFRPSERSIRLLYEKVSGSPLNVWLDLDADSTRTPFEEFRAAGYRTISAFPVIEGERVQAMMAFFSPEKFSETDFSRSLLGHLVALVTRIAQGKKAETALRKSELMLNETQRLARIGGWELNFATREMTWTEEVYRLHEVEPDCPLEYSRFIEFYHPEDGRVLMETLERSVSTGEPFDLELRFTTARNRALWVRVMGNVDFENGRPIKLTGTFQDITQRKTAENEKRQLEIRLQHSQKMEAIGTLAGGIAHDFNNILAAIAGFAELAQLDTEESHPAANSLSRILSAAHRARDLVRQILTFSRRGPQNKKVLPMETVVEDALHLIRAIIPKSVEIKKHFSSEAAYVLGDETQIHQLLINLCTNAAQAMDRKTGSIDIYLEAADVDGGSSPSLARLKPGPYVRLSVSDSGPGISKEILDRIFEPFFTTKKTGEGTGMGLAVVYGIVESHQGGIEVESAPGHGSTFHIYLPLAKPPQANSSPAPKASIARGNGRILFVDDEQALTGLFREALTRQGYSVEVRNDSPAALEHFRSRPQDFDLVITDLSMPKMRGVELIRKIREIRPDVSAILCTGYADDQLDRELAQTPIQLILQKPLNILELLKAIQAVLDEAGNPAITGNIS